MTYENPKPVGFDHTAERAAEQRKRRTGVMLNYDDIILSLKRLADRPRPIYAEQDAIDFAVTWFEANQDDIKEFLGEPGF